MDISRRALLLGSLVAGVGLPLATGLARAEPRSRPNIITIVLDDVGYADLGCFGAEIRTPHIDALAAEGLRYNHFDSKAVCSPTRAALMTGRNSHTVNMPDVPDIAILFEGDPAAPSFTIPDNAHTVAQVLQGQGYATWAVGKWHLIPREELPEVAPRTCWPRQRGFDYFYGFSSGWTDQYQPELAENDRYLHREFPPGYHLSVDLVDKAVALIEDAHRADPSRPFYLNLGFGAAHGPLQVPREYSQSYDAVYAKGWDAIRAERFERQKGLGIIPQETILTERSAEDRAWDQLGAEEKAVFARYMAVYAGFVEHCDEQVGRLVATLERLNVRDDTLIVLISDNGAASEGGQDGNFDGLYRPNTVPIAEQLQRLDELGGPLTQAEYPRPWAMAGVTPLRRYKTWPYSGGTRTPMIVSWPAQIAERGAIRRQFVDVVDIAPTLLAAAGTAFPASLRGVAEIPVAGTSFLPTLQSASAPGRTTQYFELRGQRAVTAGRWRAVARHDCGTSFEADRWQLFDLGTDFSEAVDVSAQHPDTATQLQTVWAAEWQKHSAMPLKQPPPVLCSPDGTDVATGQR